LQLDVFYASRFARRLVFYGYVQPTMANAGQSFLRANVPTGPRQFLRVRATFSDA